jgi:hypothetical protein
MAGFAGVKPQPNSSFKKLNQHCQLHKENKIDKPIIIGHSMVVVWL